MSRSTHHISPIMYLEQFVPHALPTRVVAVRDAPVLGYERYQHPHCAMLLGIVI